ncbi:glycine zipper 2TM domain-containing protein [Sphingomonas sp. KR1UV-12]|uniref:17 kDa surface antigen n=1 Tax=Sphingomonas aurea TaxID=3063994 RepID=A0ABT9EL60_9SPHN|nr:glycine zipper 2TM domain-containing protein [Sphingomonas sp. KR1UV-12]MDP1027705.1 glycine zipper 2TM domain-containing protein [Sphingomonas sp. KR1UV-12]
MFKTFTLAAAAVAMTASAVVPVSAADARPRRHWHGDRYEQRYDRRDYRDACRRKGIGSTGTVVGAIAGGLLGRTIDTRGDRTMGTLLGAGAGALAGRAVERGERPGYCR